MFGIQETLDSKYFRSSGIFANGRGKWGDGRAIFYGSVAGSNTWGQWGLRDTAETHIERIKIIGGVGFYPRRW